MRRWKTEDLCIGQAATLCVRVFRDESQPKSERAVALCWILHLFADGHQPCHAGSLYAPCFDDGDRGANGIRLGGGGNLHAAWDRLLGNRASAGDVRRRVAELGDVRSKLASEAKQGGEKWLLPETWLTESREYGRSHVYTDEVTGPVIAASRGATARLPKLKLSADYFVAEGKVARMQAKRAAYRVASVLTVDSESVQ
ncbi:hypothetical protein NZK35_23125 [Stieleria sp. ICT_E10.1]|uniref:S1/P1 nuclease n=1 Tax=Stieleria sedimenti TaxID=2976331 RepID=UPI00217FF53B|nr:S1/P1 nuclease [Stieleria sedimenti]MCS7469555.1 hypothetical protein [Stieleria sedimenti]